MDALIVQQLTAEDAILQVNAYAARAYSISTQIPSTALLAAPSLTATIVSQVKLHAPNARIPLKMLVEYASVKQVVLLVIARSVSLVTIINALTVRMDTAPMMQEDAIKLPALENNF